MAWLIRLRNLLAAERHRLADDVGVELLALGDHGGEHSGADRAAEIAQHVADAATSWGARSPVVTDVSGVSTMA